MYNIKGNTILYKMFNIYIRVIFVSSFKYIKTSQFIHIYTYKEIEEQHKK